VDSLIFRYFLIERIRDFHRAVLHTGRTTCAFVLPYVPRFPEEGYREVPCLSLYITYFSIGQNFYVRMPADLDQFWREYSDGTLISRKGLVELGHMSAYRGCTINQKYLKSRVSQIEGCLYTAYTPSHNEDISVVSPFLRET
jgi:hypothetical protein